MELSFAFQSLGALKTLQVVMTHEFWRSRFLALMYKRQPTSFWLVILLFLWNAQVPAVGDHEQVFNIDPLFCWTLSILMEFQTGL